MITVAQIGVGYWGPNLLRNLVSSKECNVKIIADISEQRRDFVGNLYPMIYLTEKSADVFQDDEIDAIIIATPVATHFDLSMQALRAGKHILVEKPMATSVKEVEEIGNLAEKENLVAMVGHTFLYNNAVRYVKQLIDSGELGDIRYIYCQRLNLGRIRRDVDALWNFGPHDISIIQYWLGEQAPLKVTRSGMDYVQPGIADVGFVKRSFAEIGFTKISAIQICGHKVGFAEITPAEVKLAEVS